MEVNNLITLNNKDNFLLLEEVLHEDCKYFFCVRVNEDKTKPVNDYAFLKDDTKDNKKSVTIVKEESLIEKLYDIILKDFINS